MLRFYFFALICSFAWNSFAAESLQSSIHRSYQSPRALGMGGAFVAVANDYSAIFYNPAGLARREDGQINLSMELGFSPSYFTFANDVKDVAGVNGTEADKFKSFSDFLLDQYGKQFSLRAGLFEAFWVRPNWGIAIIPADLSIDIQILNQAAPAMDIRTYLDTTIAYSYANYLKGYVDGILTYGVTAKFVNRGFASKQLNSWDLVADSTFFKQSDLRDGYTIDADLGVLYTPDLPSDGIFSLLNLAKPTFGMTVRNVLDYGFTNSFRLFNKNEVEAPEKLHRVVDLGTKWEYPSLWIFQGRGVMDFTDIMHPSYNFRKGLHIGFEFDWTVASWWKGQYRVGLNQGFVTAGVSALFALFNLDLVTYGEDIGTNKNPQENRMYLLKMNVDI